MTLLIYIKKKVFKGRLKIKNKEIPRDGGTGMGGSTATVRHLYTADKEKQIL